MDNFAWVNELSERLEEQGQQRLAYLIHDIPYQKYLGNHALVEALVPEALAAARGLEIPWLDVYFKHWQCASRIALLQGEVLLGDVVTAYEAAHQDKTQGCPQTVCVTQDLVATYANVDGPGWAAERLAACDETLARIDPSWGCFGCLTIERANAMADQGERQEAVLYLQSQRELQLKAGEEVTTIYVTTEVEQWLAMGQPQKALARLEETEEEADEDDRTEQATRLLQRARALGMLGQAQEAWDLLPEFDDVEVPDYVLWTRAAVVAARALRALNTPALGHAFWTVLEHLHTAGSHRLLLDLALVQSELAQTRAVPWLAEQALALAAEHVPQLRDDLGASAALQKARQTLAHAQDLPMPCTADKLDEWLQSPEAQEQDNERVIQWLKQALRERPEDTELVRTLAAALGNFGAHALARQQLQALVLAHPDSPALQNQWFRLCFETDDMEAIEQQAHRIEAHQPALAAWYRARVAFHEERYAQVGPFVQTVLTHDPEAMPTRRLWADAAMQLKDFETALEQRRQILEGTQEVEPGQRWEVMIAATAAGQWPVVREQAKHLGMELDQVADPASPVEEDWGMVYLRIEDEGRQSDVLARRTGPATARILQPSARGRAQRLDDWVVITAQLAEQPPEDPEEQEHYVRVFNEPIHVLQKGGFGPSYMIDGVHPGEAQVDALRSALDALGWRSWQYSNDHYRVTDPDAPEDDDVDAALDDEDDGKPSGLPGLYLAVSAPTQVAPEVIAERLAALCKGHQLSWLELARAAGHDTQWHEAMHERYDL